MNIDRLNELTQWMNSPEDEHLEFKAAKASYEFDKLAHYCVALANEGGGKIILGVTDRRPRTVVGTDAFQDPYRTVHGLLDRLNFRIEAETINHPDGRVLVFHVPSRPIGVPLNDKGTYWMRSGESLVPMPAGVLQSIFAESTPDYTALVCPNATVDDLDAACVERFRELWIRSSGNSSLSALPPKQLLHDAELLVDEGVTYAALILLGTALAVRRHLAQAEIIFEYRSSEVSGPASQRLEFKQGFLPILDTLWNTINLRNDRQSFQDGPFVFTIPTFNERAVREALLNAAAHRDYRLGGSVFVRQFPRRLEIVSPGGFPPGITVDNILFRHSPRNRRIAESFARCGLVERAGQGVNRMFEESIRESKPIPDFSDSDPYQVSIVLRGEIQDERFLRFLEKIGSEQINSFTTNDFLALDLVHRSQTVPDAYAINLVALADQGVIEPVGDGKFVLSRALYAFLGQKGVYTRKRGLDRETNKELLVKHIRDNNEDGSKFEELLQVLPALSRRQIQRLADELKTEGRIRVEGRTSAARWFLA